jgi:hypothetical protein
VLEAVLTPIFSLVLDRDRASAEKASHFAFPMSVAGSCILIKTSGYATSLAYFALKRCHRRRDSREELVFKKLQVSPDLFSALPHDKSRTSFLAITCFLRVFSL